MNLFSFKPQNNQIIIDSDESININKMIDNKANKSNIKMIPKIYS